jgi:hypothetical protein
MDDLNLVAFLVLLATSFVLLWATSERPREPDALRPIREPLPPRPQFKPGCLLQQFICLRGPEKYVLIFDPRLTNQAIAAVHRWAANPGFGLLPCCAAPP